MESQAISTRQPSGFKYLWLVYLAFFFIEPVFDRGRPLLWAKTLLVTAVFLGIFHVYVSTRRENVQRAMIAVTFALGLLSLPWNGGASVFFIYTASFLPFAIPSVRLVLSLFAVEVLCALAEGYWLHASWNSVGIAVFLSLVIGTGNIFFAQQKRADCKLRALLEENISLAAVAERERIARDLHDVLGHTLSLIVLKAELAGRLLHSVAGAERAKGEIADVERTARTALAEVREAISGYRSRGLIAEIEAARRTLDAAGVSLECDMMQVAAGALGPNEETTLVLALREAVTNIVRHARASKCTLRFQVKDNQHQLIISDDGGTAERAQAAGELREGNGLRGMRQRVEALGGRVSIERAEGTRLSIALPVSTS